MATSGSLRRTSARFGPYQLDLSSRELFRAGVRAPIQVQPFQVLRLLLEAEGKVVRREDLRAALWPEDTFVDFEHGVNTAVKKLRQALEDSVEEPRFIETLPKVGYRFITAVEWCGEANGESVPNRVVPISGPERIPVPRSVRGTDPSRSTAPRWHLFGLAFVLAMLVCAGLYVARNRFESRPAELTITPFTTFPGFEIAPHFSPDGNQIVFSWFGYEKDYQFDLYIKQVGQEHIVQLTHHPAVFLASAWSPDGRFIAFKREAEPDASGVYVIPALGGAERKLASITPFGGPEAIAVNWSSDSKWVAFSESSSLHETPASSSQHFKIHLVNVDTYEERTLQPPAGECIDTLHPAFSPDDKYLGSICVLTQGSFRIYVSRPDGTNPRSVADVKSAEGFADLDWAADSRSLIYAAGMHLWRVPLSGGKQERLLFAQDTESVTVARRGNRLAFAQVRHPSSLWQLQLAGPTKAVSAATKLVSSSRGDAWPRVSRNGRFLAFQSYRSGSPELWISDRDASNPTQLTSFGGAQIGPPSWSPDGHRIVFDVRASDKPELYVVNTDGSLPKRLPISTLNACYPFWSADGRSIYFSTEPPGAIWKMPSDGGPAVRLTGDQEGGNAPQEAADGQRVYYDKFKNGQTHTWSASTLGGDERSVSGMPGDVTWVLASRGIYFVQGAPRHFSLNYMDFSSRRIHKVTELPGLFAQWGSFFSPNSNTFLLSGIEHSEADIILADGFH